MAERLIQPVSDNTYKQRTYKTMLGRYNLAMKHGFYLEAILIDYAMMEDRLRSFIYHIGGFHNRESVKISGKAKPHLKRMVLDIDTKGNLGVNSIFGKRRIVQAVLNWEETNIREDEDKYLKSLRGRIESLDVGGLLDTLKDIESWCDYRNECIHSVMNKNMDSLGDEIAKKAEEGMLYARFLDSQIRLLKKRNVIRRSIGLRTD